MLSEAECQADTSGRCDKRQIRHFFQFMSAHTVKWHAHSKQGASYNGTEPGHHRHMYSPFQYMYSSCKIRILMYIGIYQVKHKAADNDAASDRT